MALSYASLNLSGLPHYHICAVQEHLIVCLRCDQPMGLMSGALS